MHAPRARGPYVGVSADPSTRTARAPPAELYLNLIKVAPP
eukprot:SAG31_NODE_21243_length_554_cov_1.013187_1_plen_39_part_10